MKKSVIAIFLASLMLFSSLSGCGNEPSEDNEKLKNANVKINANVKQSEKFTIIDSKYDDGLELGVISYDVVKDYGADNTGKIDATEAINNAMFQAQVDGGGTVYLPEGKYLITDVIVVPANVVLRGEWQSPNEKKAGSVGSILIADNDSIFLEDPVVFLNESSAIQNATIVYPNQSVENPIEYYYAIEIGFKRCFTIQNTTVIGAWNGIAVGSFERSHEIYYLKNVYVSAMNIGIFNHGTTDTGRMEQVYVSPEYWMDNTLYPMNDSQKQKTRDYFRTHAYGFDFYTNDWSVAYDIYTSDLLIGMNFAQHKTSRPMNGKFMNVTMENCDTGIYIKMTKLAGVDFTNLKIITDWESSAAINSSTEQNGTCMFYNTEITGPFKTPIQNNGLGQTSTSSAFNFVSGKISGYDAENNYAVTLNGGSITMQEFEFGETKKHIKVSDKIQSLQLLGCTFKGEPDVSVPAASKANYHIDNTPIKNHDLQNKEHIYREDVPGVKNRVIVDICDYGADKKNEDNTEAVQKALDSLCGLGGIVYIPAGNWMFKGELVVPSGVELRGSTPVQQIQNKDCNTGTILWIYSGKGNENGTPFITLEEGSGVRGFCAFYPEPMENDQVAPYPWTVRAVGKNCWAEDITLSNSYNGLDFGTYKTDGFYIDFIGGSPVRRGVFVGNADEGWFQNCQFNPNYAYINSRNMGNIDYRLYHCDAFIVGAVEKLHCFNLFEYGSKTGMLFFEQDGKSANGAVINLGIDGTENSLRIWKAGEIEFVNPQLVAMASINQKNNILVEETFEGNAYFINSNVWGPTNVLLNVQGGNVDINLMNICTGYGEYALHMTGGKVNMNSAIFHNKNTLIDGKAEEINLYGCYVRNYQNKIELDVKCNAKTDNKHAWWS